jgi:hypothetical protein
LVISDSKAPTTSLRLIIAASFHWVAIQGVVVDVDFVAGAAVSFF